MNKNCQKLHNHFSISRARKWTVTICLFFKGVPRQRGRGFGALARTVARTTLPILKKYVLPAAKKIRRDVIESAIPEIGGVLSGQTSIKIAVKKTAKSTIQKQVGGGTKRGKTLDKVLLDIKLHQQFLTLWTNLRKV